MSLAKIISIPGMSGLFKMIAEMRNGGYIVESLADQKRVPVSSTQRIVMLEDISVYTVEGDMPLNDVFLKMKENDEACSNVSPKAEPAELKSALKKVVPEFDEERVHASDIKKMFSWYVLLKDIIGKEPEADKAETVKDEPSASAEKPAAKEKKAKTAAKSKTDEEEKPKAEKKPKAPAKKKAEKK